MYAQMKSVALPVITAINFIKTTSLAICDGTLCNSHHGSIVIPHTKELKHSSSGLSRAVIPKGLLTFVDST